MEQKIIKPLKTFYKKVDLRSKKEMVEFLTNHYRYNTMSSWNQSTSYANKVKIHSVIPASHSNTVYELIDTEGFYERLNDILNDWGRENDWKYQAGFNGRSGGYIVMYEGYRKESSHKSRCSSCYQRNFKKVPDFDTTTDEGKFKLYFIAHPMWTTEVYLRRSADEVKALNLTDEQIRDILIQRKLLEEYTTDNRCGKCGAYDRKNVKLYETGCWPGRSIDMHEDFEDWGMGSLKERVQLVQSFDKMCDSVVEETIYMASEYHVEEVEVPCTRKEKRVVENQ